MKIKLKKVHKQGIVGIGFQIIGIYMVLFLQDIHGLIPFIIGMLVLLWRFK